MAGRRREANHELFRHPRFGVERHDLVCGEDRRQALVPAALYLLALEDAS